MTTIAATDLIVPVGVGLLALWTIARINHGEDKPASRKYEMEKLAYGVNGNLAKWQDASTHGHHIPLQYEAEAPEYNDRVEYIKTDYRGNIVLPEDRGHAYSTGFHPNLTRSNGQQVTLRMINDHKKSVAQTKPGYPKRKPRSEAISK